MPLRNLFPPKVSSAAFFQELTRLVALLLENPKIELILIVVDAHYIERTGGRPLELALCEIATPQQINADFLARFAPRRTHVLYGVECNSDGLPAIAQIVAAGFKFSPFGGAPVGAYAYENGGALATVERQFLHQQMAGYAKFEDPGSCDDFLNLCQALETTRRIPGAVVEIGCFRGSSSSVMLDYAQHNGLERAFYFFDTFDGFSYEAARTSPDVMWQGTHATEGHAVVETRLRAIGYPHLQVHRANIITDALPAEITQIAVANVDVDLYEAVLAGLNKVAALIAPGGIIICEDAGHTPNLIGARLALLEFMNGPHGGRFTQIFMPSGQAFLIALNSPATPLPLP
jgi:hypothetical protein